MGKSRLAEFRKRVTRRSQSHHASRWSFEELTDRWRETIEPGLKPASALVRCAPQTRVDPMKPLPTKFKCGGFHLRPGVS